MICNYILYCLIPVEFTGLNMYFTWKCKSVFVVHYLHFCICIYVIVFWAGGLYYLNKLLTYLLIYKYVCPCIWLFSRYFVFIKLCSLFSLCFKQNYNFRTLSAVGHLGLFRASLSVRLFFLSHILDFFRINFLRFCILMS